MARARSTTSRSSLRRAPGQKPLYTAVDHGRAVLIKQTDFAPATRGGSWGTFAESFVRLNEHALRELDVVPTLTPSHPEPAIQLTPGGRAGAIPLRSAQTGNIVAGLIVKPRFGWTGVGEVMAETGWSASPIFLELPVVPGSARQIPPWVLAGPVLFRLRALLETMTPGYAMREEVRQTPRGQVLWARYISEFLTRGMWQRLPCRFPDLNFDPIILSNIRWAVERIRLDLLRIGKGEPVGIALIAVARTLLEKLTDIMPIRPRVPQLERFAATRLLVNTVLRDGLQALGWIADERGLGGGQEMDGLSWQLPLEILWERYVEAKIRDEVSREGGEIGVGRLGQTVFPLQWSTATARSLTHLIPDIVIRRNRSIRIVDAKYKAHFAELDEHAWTRMTDEMRDAHRSDIHQVLAYASLYEADEVTASLIYPLRRSTWEALRDRQRDCAQAELYHGNRRIKLELRGLPFGLAA